MESSTSAEKPFESRYLKAPDGKPVRVWGKINTDDDRLRKNIEANIRLGLPQVKHFALQKKARCILAGGGPSLEKCFRSLKRQRERGFKLVSMNGSHDWLIEKGVNPSVHVMLDARPSNARFVQKPLKTCRYLISSQCDPSVFDALKGQDVWIWHPDLAEEWIRDYYRGRYVLVHGGTTVMTRAIMVMRILGYWLFDIYGFDSCVVRGKHHPFEQPENDKDKTCKVTIGGRTFVTTFWMLRQTEDFLDLVKFNGDLFKARIHGDGLNAHVLKELANGSRSVELL